jgi:hypothetical protein
MHVALGILVYVVSVTDQESLQIEIHGNQALNGLGRRLGVRRQISR